MKILYVTTVGITMTFFKQLIKELLDEGHTVDIMCNETDMKVPDCYREWNCKIYHHSCSRSPLSKGNLLAIGEIKKLVEEQKYDIVHCHTPIAAMCTRVACRKLRKQGVKVMYTAHGFHFYKGAPLLNWMIYYPIEKICSYWTDVLITINQEDYNLATRKMRARRIEYVPGVGIDIDKFKNTVVNKKQKREELGIPEDAFLLLSVGELNENKNHELVIRALAEIKNKNIHYLIAGEGNLKSYLTNLCSELSLSDNVHLAGYRKDVNELYMISDAFIFPSFREGLSVSLMEAMSVGLPCLVSKIRGNVDLITNEGGILFDSHIVEECKNAINKIVNNDLKSLSVYNMQAIKKYEINEINKLMKKVYENE
ncbi:MAG: glycosyltransferase family 4 protein [Erysipelotrichaceae bacterium]|nr:glycosyltransferase family 4 protein [Erysipelotrichaceae bacterium]